jgi:hypothetical protein
MITKALEVGERGTDETTIAVLQKVDNVKKDNPNPDGSDNLLTDYELTIALLGLKPGQRGSAVLYALLEEAGLEDVLPDEEKKVKSANNDQIICGSKLPREKLARVKEVVGDFGESGAGLYRALLTVVLKKKGLLPA